MVKKWMDRWKVNKLNFVLIISTFAIGGSLCGFVGRQLMDLFEIDNRASWLIVYIIIVTLVWPFCVLLVSIPLGQFNFFKAYLSRMGKRLTGKQ